MPDRAVGATAPLWTSAVLAVAVALFGAAYGADAASAGAGPVLPVLMSALVQGGASQVAASAILAGHGAPLVAIGLGLLLNLRFLGLAMLIGPDLPGRRLLPRLLASYLVSDVPVGVALMERDPADRRRAFLRVGLLAAVAWVIGTAVGVAAGTMLDVGRLGVDGAIAAAFAALLAAQLRDVRAVVTAAVAFAATLAAMIVLPSGIAVLVGAAVGMLLVALRPEATA